MISSSFSFVTKGVFFITDLLMMTPAKKAEVEIYSKHSYDAL